MGKLLIVSKIDRIEEYKAIAEKYGLGYEYNDFFFPDVLDDEEKLEDIIRKYKESGLPSYCTMHGVFFDIIPFSYDAKIREIAFLRMKQSMQVAEKIGAKGVVFHTNTYPLLSSPVYDDNVVARTVAVMETLLAKYPGINIYLENMFDNTPDIMRRVAEQLSGHSNFGLCLDYAHAALSTSKLSEWVEALHPYIRHIHINDNELEKDSHLALGDGKIDWAEFKQYWDKYFVDCSILIEVTDPERQIKSIEYMIDKLGWEL